jgi:uncharacterized integral membrane protein (TIGR00698 family)
MKLVPGFVLVALIGAAATGLSSIYPAVSAVLITVILGFFIKNTVGVRQEFQPGIEYSLKSLLKLAIIFLGVRLSFTDLANLGARPLFIVITCIIVALLLTILMAKKLGVPPKLGALIAVGTAICGNSAAIATAGAIDADDEEVAFAIGTITLFGLLAIIFYPLIGSLLGLSDLHFGTWAGTAINDTAQVVTAGFLYSESAGEIATVVKLTRNLFIAPAVFLLSIYYTVGQARENRHVDYIKIFPWFVLGFMAMALLRTLGLLPFFLIELLKDVANFLILMAIAGIGLCTNFSSMKKLGLKALYIGLFASTLMGVLSFLLVNGLL